MTALPSTNGHTTRTALPPVITRRWLASEAKEAYLEAKRAMDSFMPRPSQQAQDIYGQAQEHFEQHQRESAGIQWNDPIEAWFDSLGSTNGVGFPNGWPMVRPQQMPYSLPMKRGEDLPLYMSEDILRIIRWNQRFVLANSEYAQAALENRVNYTVGTGFKYTVEPMPRYAGEVPEGEIANAQKLVDLFVEYNAMESREAEAQWRADAEGEFFIGLFDGEDGMLKTRFAEPDLIRSPNGDADPRTSFGIDCDRYDVEDVKGYWRVYDPTEDGYTPTFVPEAEMIHCKRNNFSTAKRGRPLFFQCEKPLIRATQMMSSLSALTRSRAKIALIRKLDQIAPTSGQSLVNSVTATGTSTSPVGTPPNNIESFADGTIITSDKRVEYDFPDAHLNPAAFVDVVYAELKGVAARAVIPEWMLTGNTSDMAAYTASLVAESPSAKSFGRNQSILTGYFGSYRIGMRRSLAMRFVWHCVERGWIPERIASMIRVVCKGPTVTTRNKAEEMTANESLNKMGAKSVQTIQEENDLDSQVENPRIKDERAAGLGAQQQQDQGSYGQHIAAITDKNGRIIHRRVGSNIKSQAGTRFGEEQAAVEAYTHAQEAEGKILVALTDKNGVKTHRWMSPEDVKAAGAE